MQVQSSSTEVSILERMRHDLSLFASGSIQNHFAIFDVHSAVVTDTVDTFY